MRLALPLAALAALALAACAGPCEELGNRLCQCSGGGSTRDTCEQQIKNQLSSAGVDKAAEQVCSDALDTCHAPSGADFCEWINTADGKVACGLAHPPPVGAAEPLP